MRRLRSRPGRSAAGSVRGWRSTCSSSVRGASGPRKAAARVSRGIAGRDAPHGTWCAPGRGAAVSRGAPPQLPRRVPHRFLLAGAPRVPAAGEKTTGAPHHVPVRRSEMRAGAHLCVEPGVAADGAAWAVHQSVVWLIELAMLTVRTSSTHSPVPGCRGASCVSACRRLWGESTMSSSSEPASSTSEMASRSGIQDAATNAESVLFSSKLFCAVRDRAATLACAAHL